MNKILQKILRWMAVGVLRRHAPFVVGITGSIGKTTTRNALVTILSSKYTVRSATQNYNNEIGVPLTIIGAQSGGRSVLGWINVGVQWVRTMFFAQYPEILILEMGIDCKGDMDYLMDFVPVQMGIVTVVRGVHAEKIGSISVIAHEKGQLIARLPADGVAILNSDDVHVAKMAEHTKAKTVFYSTMSSQANLFASDIVFHGTKGICFKINEGKTIVPVRLLYIVGVQLLPSILAACSAARAYGMNLVDIAQAVETVRPETGRMSIVKTKNDITIIDDTYNAAPASMRGAIKTLGQFSFDDNIVRRVAIIGDMNELGAVEKKEHESLARVLQENNIDVVVTVGEKMHWLHDVLIQKQKKNTDIILKHYKTLQECLEHVSEIVVPHDIILVKGSRSMEMERIVNSLV